MGRMGSHKEVATVSRTPNGMLGSSTLVRVMNFTFSFPFPGRVVHVLAIEVFTPQQNLVTIRCASFNMLLLPSWLSAKSLRGKNRTFFSVVSVKNLCKIIKKKQRK